MTEEERNGEAAAAAVLARSAGLEKAWAEHRAEVIEAIAGARTLRGSFTRPADPAAEPMPPFGAPARRAKEARR